MLLAFTCLFAAELIFMVSRLDERVDNAHRDFTQCLCSAGTGCRGAATAGGLSVHGRGGSRGFDHRGNALIEGGRDNHAS